MYRQPYLIVIFLLHYYRKISAHEFERGGLLKPIVNTIDGTPTFLSIGLQNECLLSGGGHQSHQNGGAWGGPSGSQRPQRLSRNELRQLDERELIFELVCISKSKSHISFDLWVFQ